MEKVQRFFTKQICKRSNIPFDSYYDRLQTLALRSLEYRRVEADLIMTYKIIHRLVDLESEQFFQVYKSPYSTRRHAYCLEMPKLSTNFQKSFFARRVIPVWNKLPSDLVCLKSLELFCKKLKRFDFHEVSSMQFWYRLLNFCCNDFSSNGVVGERILCTVFLFHM